MRCTDNKWLVEEFTKILDDMKKVMLAKNNDYSTGADPFKNLRRHGLYGIVVRMDDKLSRLDSFTNPLYGDFKPKVAESIDETGVDLANYAILLICLRRALAAEKNVPTTLPNTHWISQTGFCFNCGEDVANLSPICSGIMKCENHKLAKPCGLCATQPPTKEGVSK